MNPPDIATLDSNRPGAGEGNAPKLLRLRPDVLQVACAAPAPASAHERAPPDVAIQCRRSAKVERVREAAF